MEDRRLIYLTDGLNFTGVRSVGPFRFRFCNKELGPGTYRDNRDRAMLTATCRLPEGHPGPCAWVKYESITYPDAESENESA